MADEEWIIKKRDRVQGDRRTSRPDAASTLHNALADNVCPAETTTAVKHEPPDDMDTAVEIDPLDVNDDACSRDGASNVKSDGSDVWVEVPPPDTDAMVKQEMDIGPTVLQSPDIKYMMLRCNPSLENNVSQLSEVEGTPSKREGGLRATTETRQDLHAVAGTSGEPAQMESSVTEPPSVASFLACASIIATKSPHGGSDVDIEYDEDDTEIGARELTEDLYEDAEIVLTETDRIMNEVHEGLPGVNVGFEWSEDYSTFRGTRETFTAYPSEHSAHYDTPYDAFIAIWDKGIMKHIASETNRYARQTIDEQVEWDALKSKARLNEWMDTNHHELYVLFGLYIVMGYSPRLRLIDYWSTNYYMNTPGFRSIMSYNRHVLLNTFLHFTNNEDHVSPNETKLSKLQPIIDHCYAKFESLYELGEHISIDESLTLWKGRLSWAQCKRTKSVRFGMKSFELCDSRTGYLWRFMIYAGKNSAQSYDAPIKGLAQKSTGIVLKLLEGLEGKGYYLTMDDYYNSPLLARYLKSRGFDCVGTLRANRKNVPDAIKIEQSAKAGTIVARHSGDVSVLAWKDSKVVTTISTFHDAQTFSECKAGKSLTKPTVVRDYCNYMGGVDLKDEKLATYFVERKRCVKWYMKMFKRLLNVSVHNAYVLHRRTLEHSNRATMSHRDFRQALAEALVNRHSTTFSVTKVYALPGNRLQTDLGHFPGKTTRRRCARCSALGIYKKAKTTCTTCGVGLCVGPCWKEYHTEPDLKPRFDDKS